MEKDIKTYLVLYKKVFTPTSNKWLCHLWWQHPLKFFAITGNESFT